MTDVVTYIARYLVKKPDKLSVSHVQLDTRSVIQVQVSPDDLPRIIGDQGQTFRSLRNVVALTGDKERDIVVEIAS